MSAVSRPRCRARRTGAALVGTAVAAMAALSGCGPAPTTQTSTEATTVPAPPPLTTSLAATDGSWALVAMGHPDQPLDTFWEAFHLSGAAGRWTDRTPPDVADNGGLVAAPSRDGLVIGFLPSQDLRFSPLARTADGGTSYSTGLFPEGLSPVPDGLSVAPDGSAAALAGGQILASPRGLAGWRPLAGMAALHVASPASPCGVDALTAVTAISSSAVGGSVVGGSVVVGAACSGTGAVGLFRERGATFVPIGPHLPAADSRARVEVLRLGRSPDGLAALLSLTDGSLQTYLAAWYRAGAGSWTLSAPAPDAGRLTSTAVTGGGGFAVLTRATDGTLHAADIGAGGRSWSQLPDPPAQTATIAVSGGRVDALAINVTVFTDYRLRRGQWTRSQAMAVAVPFGSSS